jgi:hypothetical protein
MTPELEVSRPTAQAQDRQRPEDSTIGVTENVSDLSLHYRGLAHFFLSFAPQAESNPPLPASEPPPRSTQT